MGEIPSAIVYFDDITSDEQFGRILRELQPAEELNSSMIMVKHIRKRLRKRKFKFNKDALKRIKKLR